MRPNPEIVEILDRLTPQLPTPTEADIKRVEAAIAFAKERGGIADQLTEHLDSLPASTDPSTFAAKRLVRAVVNEIGLLDPASLRLATTFAEDLLTHIEEQA